MTIYQALCAASIKTIAFIPHAYLAVLIGLGVVILLTFVASIHNPKSVKGLENKARAIGIIATLRSLYFAH